MFMQSHITLHVSSMRKRVSAYPSLASPFAHHVCSLSCSGAGHVKVGGNSKVSLADRIHVSLCLLVEGYARCRFGLPRVCVRKLPEGMDDLFNLSGAVRFCNRRLVFKYKHFVCPSQFVVEVKRATTCTRPRTVMCDAQFMKSTCALFDTPRHHRGHFQNATTFHVRLILTQYAIYLCVHAVSKGCCLQRNKS